MLGRRLCKKKVLKLLRKYRRSGGRNESCTRWTTRSAAGTRCDAGRCEEVVAQAEEAVAEGAEEAEEDEQK